MLIFKGSEPQVFCCSLRVFHGRFTGVSRSFHALFTLLVLVENLMISFGAYTLITNSVVKWIKATIDYSEEHHLDPCKLARIQKLNLKAGSKLPASISAFKKAATSLRFACFHLHGGGLNILASASADAGDVGLDPYVVLGPRLRLPSQQPASRWNLGPGTGQVLGPSAHL